MTIEFGYNKKDVLQALRYHFLSKREIRFMIILVNVFALLSATLFYTATIVPRAFIAGSILWFLVMLAFWFLLPGAVYRRNQTFQDHFTMSFDPSSFTLGTAKGSRSWNWSSLSRYMETPKFFYLYFDARSFFLVPKSGFTNSDDLHQVREWMKTIK